MLDTASETTLDTALGVALDSIISSKGEIEVLLDIDFVSILLEFPNHYRAFMNLLPSSLFNAVNEFSRSCFIRSLTTSRIAGSVG